MASPIRALAAGRIDATTVSYGSFLPVAKTPGLSVLVTPDAFFDAAPTVSKDVPMLIGSVAVLLVANASKAAALKVVSGKYPFVCLLSFWPEFVSEMLAAFSKST